MKKLSIFYKLGIFCFLASLFFGSCNDKDIFEAVEDEGPNWEGDPMVLDVTVTLDRMGGAGTRAGATYTPTDVEYYQNYINPEKFRVLFFDQNDKFLFESKSRWVKIKEQDGEFISWKVSVPFFSYGNDYEYDWDWEEIREILTKENTQFKIALLVNRPDEEYYPGFEYTKWENSPRWFDNSGPHWKRENSIAYQIACEKAGTYIKDGIAPDVKDIFDIHHSQYDPIYDGKDHAGITDGFYSVVLGNHVGKAENSYYNDEPYMSSTSSWADWDSMYIPKNPDGSNAAAWNADKGGRKYTKMPSKKNPIPMFGVQVYQSVDPDEWLKGTTFVLDRQGENPDMPVSLLRSVARVDLLVPDSYEIEYCALYYLNPYARCEPMNIWTPTDQIWNKDHYITDASGKPTGTYCDEQRLMEYGPITENGGTAVGNTTAQQEESSKTKYWEKLAWMYGAWLEKSDVWDWGPKSAEWAQSIVDEVGIDPPQVMNACIQRNNILVLPDNQRFNDVPGYHHYIAYVGERHTNAPSALQNIGNQGSGNPTVFYWTLGMYPKGDYAARARYSIALGDYDNVYGEGFGNACFKDITNENSYPKTHGDTYPAEPGNNMGTIDSGYGSGFMSAYQAGTGPGPLPIIRNHVYTLKLVPVGSRAGSGEAADFRVEGKVTKSESINFSKRIRRSSAPVTTKK